MPRTFAFASKMLLVATLLSAFTSPASALYCNRRIVGTGNVPAYVMSVCGEPASMISRVESRPQVVWDARGNSAMYVDYVQVDIWVYDFGPNRLMVELTFEDGVLGRERTLGYGTQRATPVAYGR